MANLNTIKMIGLVVLLAIALTLPAVLPKVDEANDSHVQKDGVEVLLLGTV
ncbi:MAG: hypothetical protein L3J30_07995 [Marinosulfonomonas sp.]|nr:hypothetical protein [Marinosulfonomonas sp.]